MRKRPSIALVISLISLFVALSGWGYAATGGTIVLGKANSAGAPTRLTSEAAQGQTLVLKNTGGQAAASFSVNAGVPPFNVGSTAKVQRLNADLLDGVDSAGFYAAGSKVTDADALDGVDSTALQRRISKACAAGSAIKTVNADGTVVCEAFPTGVLSGWEIVRGNVATLDGRVGNFASSDARCPSGKQVIGGGFNNRGGNTTPIPNYRVDNNGDAGFLSLWRAYLIVESGSPTGGSFHFQAFAVCARIS